MLTFRALDVYLLLGYNNRLTFGALCIYSMANTYGTTVTAGLVIIVVEGVLAGRYLRASAFGKKRRMVDNLSSRTASTVSYSTAISRFNSKKGKERKTVSIKSKNLQL